MMSFHLFLYDENFDLINGELPGTYEAYFGDQMDRARAILNGRSLTQLQNGLDSLDWMLRKGSEIQNTNSMKIADEKGYCVISRVKALNIYAEEFDITNQAHFPNATWADYYALLTLAYVREVLLPANYNGLNTENSTFTGSYPFHLDFPIECMEAICIAEYHKKLASINPNKVMQERGSKGGRVRVSKFDNLKTSVYKLYSDKYSNRSNRDAAKHISRILENEIKVILTTDDPAHTLAKWIGNYKKRKKIK